MIFMAARANDSCAQTYSFGRCEVWVWDKNKLFDSETDRLVVQSVSSYDITRVALLVKQIFPVQNKNTNK